MGGRRLGLKVRGLLRRRAAGRPAPEDAPAGAAPPPGVAAPPAGPVAPAPAAGASGAPPARASAPPPAGPFVRASRPPKAPRSLVVLGFDARRRADEALRAVKRLHAQKKLVLHDAVFVAKDRAGSVHVTETVDPTPGSAALDGSVWGLLLGTLLGGPVGGLVAGALSAGTGALLAKLIDVGVPDATVRELRRAVPPGTTALALLLSHIDQEAVLAELRHFAGAKLVATTLSEAALAAVNEALGPGP